MQLDITTTNQKKIRGDVSRAPYACRILSVKQQKRHSCKGKLSLSEAKAVSYCSGQSRFKQLVFTVAILQCLLTDSGLIPSQHYCHLFSLILARPYQIRPCDWFMFGSRGMGYDTLSKFKLCSREYKDPVSVSNPVFCVT